MKNKKILLELKFDSNSIFYSSYLNLSGKFGSPVKKLLPIFKDKTGLTANKKRDKLINNFFFCFIFIPLSYEIYAKHTITLFTNIVNNITIFSIFIM